MKLYSCNPIHCRLISHILFQLLIEVDYLKNMDGPFIQIKGPNKEAVAAAGLALNLEGTYTTMVILSFVDYQCKHSKIVHPYDTQYNNMKIYQVVGILGFIKTF